MTIKQKLHSHTGTNYRNDVFKMKYLYCIKASSQYKLTQHMIVTTATDVII